ncbi:hypothetical protein SMA90_32155, partial [Escherichia coli]
MVHVGQGHESRQAGSQRGAIGQQGILEQLWQAPEPGKPAQSGAESVAQGDDAQHRQKGQLEAQAEQVQRADEQDDEKG